LNPEGPVLVAKVDNEIVDATLLCKTGRKVPARFIRRDKDLDLAFLAPKEPMGKLAHIAFQKRPLSEELDDLIFLYRVDNSLNYQPAISLGTVAAIVKRRATFIVSDAGVDGAPVFDGAGRPLGISVRRVRDGKNLEPQPVILAAEDVAAAIQRTIKAGE